MTEYTDKSMEEITSEFIVGTCQLLPKSCGVVSDRVRSQRGYCMCCGSAMEFYIRPLNSCVNDIDVLLFRNDELAFVENFPELPHDVSGLHDSIVCYKIGQYLKYPGFVRLRGLGKINYNWKWKKYEFSPRTIPNRYSAYDIVAEAINVGPVKAIASIARGPAITLQLNSDFERMDMVRSVWCPQWPKEARNWPKRRKEYGWPTIDTISEVVQNGCHVVYVQHRACRKDKAQWRLSFSIAEVILLQSWTQTQQIAYHLLRFFAKRELIQTDCPKGDEILCTYHLKTLLLWTCEEMSPEWWNSSSVIVICGELLRKLSEWLKGRNCPNYFIPEANLFHESSSSSMLEKTVRRLDDFRNSGILCNWFVENYIHPFIQAHFKVEDTLEVWTPVGDYMQRLFIIRKVLESLSLDYFFSHELVCCSRTIIKSDGLFRSFGVRLWFLFRKFVLFTDSRMSITIPIPEKVWCFTYFDTTMFCLYAANGLSFGNILLESEVFVEFVNEQFFKPNIVRCQHHRYPEPTTKGSQFQFLRAQNFLEHLNGSESRSVFQLVSLMSKMFLKEALISDDSQSDIIVPATLVYMAALHFVASQYQIVVNLCTPVLQEPQLFIQSETLNAGCLFFIDDVVRIVGFCLISKRISENMQFSKRQIYLDLRITPKVLAFYLAVISAKRLSKQLGFNPNFRNPSFPFDQWLMVSTKNKFCISMQSSTCLKAVRQCVYRRTDSLTANTTSCVNHSRIAEEITDALLEYALENLTLFYGVIGIKCNTANYYRALYFYKSRQYNEALYLCERILHEPDLQSDLKEFAYANVLVLPPLDSFFDRDAQCLLGLHTLFFYLSPLNDDLRKSEVTLDSTFAHIFSCNVYSNKDSLSVSTLWPYPVRCHYSLGGHFLARYLKIRCLIDCGHPWTEALAEFAAMKCNYPFEHIIHRFFCKYFVKVV